jgi:3-deoxy-D-manno-octulosonic-acid transferase
VYLLYSFLLTLGFIILLPRFAVDAFRNGKYVTGLRQRLGNLPRIDHEGSPVIWLHCVSVGEAQAAQSLIRALAKVFPRFRLVISTTTVTGQKVAQQIFAEQAAAVFYFPIDWAWTVRRALRKIQPAAIIVMETELWPRLFRESRKRDIPVALVNGRISDKSFRRYRRIRSFMRRVLNDITVAVMQTDTDAHRIQELGLDEHRIKISGNLKFDSAAVEVDALLTNEIRARFGFADNRPLIVAASTHGGEEATMVDAFKNIKQSHPTTRTIFAPRHPERFAEVASLLESSGFKFVQRSSPPSPDDALADFILLDTIGELRAVYSLEAIVFVGGSLVPHGGHNVIEPALHGICTITGPHTQNFTAIVKALRDQDALIQLSSMADAVELSSIINQLLDDETLRTAIGQRAKVVCENNRGATEKTIGFLSQILAATEREHQQVALPSLQVTTAK